MIDPETGQPHTAHTTNPVPFIALGPGLAARKLAAAGGCATSRRRSSNTWASNNRRRWTASACSRGRRGEHRPAAHRPRARRAELTARSRRAGPRKTTTSGRRPITCPTRSSKRSSSGGARRGRRRITPRRGDSARTRSAARAAAQTERSAARGSGGSSTGSGSRRRPEFRRAGSDEGNAVRRAYAALEVPPGSDFETVRRAYRAMMRKYHPDLHTSTPEKQKAANEIAQKLTDSYKLLEKRLRK